PWLLDATADEAPAPLGPAAQALLEMLEKRGAMFFNELQSQTGRMRADLDQALWELVAAGRVTCDGFGGLRILIDPDKRRQKERLLSHYPRSRPPIAMRAGGRWYIRRLGTSGRYDQGVR